LESDANDPVMNSPAQSFNFLLKKGKSYVFTMTSREFDPYLRLENMAALNLKNEDFADPGSRRWFLRHGRTAFIA